jgi:hypothetical protein|tara:strand:+ start:81 stop:212 length:132 start_codon:yes stop_codon:yes gene_type:complete
MIHYLTTGQVMALISANINVANLNPSNLTPKMIDILIKAGEWK